jgi:hypothetical protein
MALLLSDVEIADSWIFDARWPAKTQRVNKCTIRSIFLAA